LKIQLSSHYANYNNLFNKTQLHAWILDVSPEVGRLEIGQRRLHTLLEIIHFGDKRTLHNALL
jgi:hypothetical protein